MSCTAVYLRRKDGAAERAETGDIAYLLAQFARLRESLGEPKGEVDHAIDVFMARWMR